MVRVALLGGLALEVDGRTVAVPRAAGARGLLAWLALHRGPQPRAALAPTFWPAVRDTSARQSLRNALWSLRRDLGGAAAAVVADADTLELRDADVDVHALERALERGDGRTALALGARGELLAGMQDDWVLAARDDLRERLGCALGALLAEVGPGEALAVARARVRMDPLSEAAVRDLMARLADAGEVAAALSAYDRFARRVRHELRAAPSARTRAVAEDLRAASWAPRFRDGLPARG
jgi:DNA-binding SARP family transcriptional activator